MAALARTDRTGLDQPSRIGALTLQPLKPIVKTSRPAMKATVDILGSSATEERSWLTVWADLFKARLTTLVLLTTLVGFYMGQSETTDVVRLIHTLLGTAFVAAGASAFEPILERDRDALMARTLTRPLPSGE